jgi:hypothetical protein
VEVIFDVNGDGVFHRLDVLSLSPDSRAERDRKNTKARAIYPGFERQ